MYVIGVYGQVKVARLQLVEFALLSGATTVLENHTDRYWQRRPLPNKRSIRTK